MFKMLNVVLVTFTLQFCFGSFVHSAAKHYGRISRIDSGYVNGSLGRVLRDNVITRHRQHNRARWDHLFNLLVDAFERDGPQRIWYKNDALSVTLNVSKRNEELIIDVKSIALAGLGFSERPKGLNTAFGKFLGTVLDAVVDAKEEHPEVVRLKVMARGTSKPMLIAMFEKIGFVKTIQNNEFDREDRLLVPQESWELSIPIYE